MERERCMVQGREEGREGDEEHGGGRRGGREMRSMVEGRREGREGREGQEVHCSGRDAW